MQLLNSTQVPNSILAEIFKGKLTERETKMLLYICRKTIGWHKEVEWLTETLIQKDLGFKKSHTSLVLKTLEQKEAIIRWKHPTVGWVIILNPYKWGEWEDDDPRIKEFEHIWLYNVCFYCKSGPIQQMDHYISKANGGSDLIENLVPVCATCNWDKGSMNGDEYQRLKGLPVETKDEWAMKHSYQFSNPAVTNLVTSKLPNWSPYKIKNNKKDKLKEDKINIKNPEVVQKIYDLYSKKINSKSKLTQRAKEKIQTRLSFFKAEELEEAIHNFSKNNWWMKHNAQRGIVWFFRSDDQVDRFITLETDIDPDAIRE